MTPVLLGSFVVLFLLGTSHFSDVNLDHPESRSPIGGTLTRSAYGSYSRWASFRFTSIACRYGVIVTRVTIRFG